MVSVQFSKYSFNFQVFNPLGGFGGPRGRPPVSRGPRGVLGRRLRVGVRVNLGQVVARRDVVLLPDPAVRLVVLRRELLAVAAPGRCPAQERRQSSTAARRQEGELCADRKTQR